MSSKSKEAGSNVEVDVPLFREKSIIGNKLLLVTQQCPAEVAAALSKKIALQDMTWFEDQPLATSRRKVAIVELSSDISVVVKEKQEMRSDPSMKVDFFTRSVVHEMRTSYGLRQALDELPLPSHLVYLEEEFTLSFDAQLPLAAILNLEDPRERFTVFAYIPGDSAREEVAAYGGWNQTPAEKRKLFGLFHQVLCSISNALVERGIEPWDLGVHQLIYEIDHEKRQIFLGILDTEEYNLSKRYGEYWPDQFTEIGLPAILPLL